MSILVDRKTRVLVQGITGSEGTFHTSQMLEYGTKIVGGVTPGEAAAAVKPDATIIFVPPPFAADAMLEAIDAKIKLIICITEGVPTKDMIKVYSALKDSNSRLIGPNCPGIITPNECKLLTKQLNSFPIWESVSQLFWESAVTRLSAHSLLMQSNCSTTTPKHGQFL